MLHLQYNRGSKISTSFNTKQHQMTISSHGLLGNLPTNHLFLNPAVYRTILRLGNLTQMSKLIEVFGQVNQANNCPKTK